MKIADARAAVVAAAQNYRPNLDFPVPDSLVDFYLFQVAAAAINNRAIVIPASWMFTTFTCQTAAVEAGPCGSKWRVQLPFVPAEMHDAIGTVAMKDPIVSDRAIHLRRVNISTIGVSSGMVDPPSPTRPAFVLDGTDLYLIGRKSFNDCSIFISAIVGGLKEGYECSPDMEVPVPQGGGAEIIDTVTRLLIQYITGKAEDKLEDDEYDQRESAAL